MQTKQPYQIKGPTYFWLDTWIMANIIQLATQEFCRRFLNMNNDPCGRQFDQMTQAARSGQANIAEGNARHFTSRETEMKLTDVARASIAELAGDFNNWLLSHNEVPWSIYSNEYKAVYSITLDKPEYKNDIPHESGLHILAQKNKFMPWINSENSIIVANSLLILCNRVSLMLNKHMESLLNNFRIEGGFTETLTTERLEARTKISEDSDAPKCPKCNRPMIKRVAKKGINSGHEFWSCSAYPECNGIRNI